MSDHMSATFSRFFQVVRVVDLAQSVRQIAFLGSVFGYRLLVRNVSKEPRSSIQSVEG